ncbi:MAG TPA: gamma-glutamyltransferase [Actinomycetes bacterium]|nr:gamma-glutamyltransferase [Actinomycetes bacterium]
MIRSRLVVTKQTPLAPHGMVAAEHPRGAAVGAAILARGGNAVDAAVATAVAMTVVEPFMSTIAGSGTMLVHLARRGETIALNFNGVAPLAAHESIYNVLGGVSDGLFGWPRTENAANEYGHRAVAVPGSLAGLALVDGALLGVAEWAGATLEEARRRLAPPRFAVPLADWLARAGRFDAGGPGGPPGGRPWVRDYLRAGVEVDDQGVARSRFHFDNHLQVVDALYDQRPPALYPLVDCPVLLCPAADPVDGGALAEAKRGAAVRATKLLPSATLTWFEDTMHDIPLQRPAELAAELARFADSLQEVPGNG